MVKDALREVTQGITDFRQLERTPVDDLSTLRGYENEFGSLQSELQIVLASIRRTGWSLLLQGDKQATGQS